MFRTIGRRRSSNASVWIRRTAYALACLLVVAMHTSAGRAQGGAEPFAPIEEFKRRVDEFKNAAPDLQKRLEQGAKTIDSLTEKDIDKARREIEELRAVVGQLLGRVSDNSELAKLGDNVLSHAREKKKLLERDARFKVEERDYLIELWNRILGETERAAADLDNARREFSEVLQTLQTRQDFIDEVLQASRAIDAVKIMRKLAEDIREASRKLRTLLEGIKAPGV